MEITDYKKFEEIEREVNDDQIYLNPFKAREYLKYLLSIISQLAESKENRFQSYINCIEDIRKIVKEIPE